MSTPLDARLAIHVDRFERKLWHVEERFAQRMNQLFRRWERLGQMRNAQTIVTERVAQLEQDVEGLRRSEAERPLGPKPWSIAVAALVAIIGAVLLRRQLGSPALVSPLAGGHTVVVPVESAPHVRGAKRRRLRSRT